MIILWLLVRLYHNEPHYVVWAGSGELEKLDWVDGQTAPWILCIEPPVKSTH
jgi:hypothetical protein